MTDSFLKRVADKLFPENGRAIDSHEFRNLAALKLRIGKEDSKILRKDLEEANLIECFGPMKSLMARSTSLNRSQNIIKPLNFKEILKENSEK